MSLGKANKQQTIRGCAERSKGGDDYKLLKRSPWRTIWFNVAKKRVWKAHTNNKRKKKTAQK